MNPHSVDIVEQNCGLCGTGCRVEVSVQTDKITQIAPANNGHFNGNNLCFSGRFGWQIYENGNKIKTAFKLNPGNMKNIEDFLTPISKKDEIVAMLKAKLEVSQTRKIYIAPTVTNEEILLMKEVSQKIGAEISTISLHNNFVDKLRDTNLYQKTYQDFSDAEVIVIVGKIRRTLKSLLRIQQQAGKRMIIISNEDTKFNEFADELFTEEPIDETLDKIIENYYDREDNEKEQEAINPIELELPEKTLFVYDRGNVSEDIAWNVWMLASVICNFQAGSGVMETSNFANSKGLHKFGIKSGKVETSDFVILYGELPCEEQKGILKNSKFILSISTHIDDNDPAHLILPAPSYLELNGTAIANDGGITEFNNPKNSTVFDELLNVFYEAGFIGKTQNSNKFWLKKVKKELDIKPEVTEMNDEKLLDLLYTVENAKIDIPVQHCLQKNLIAKLKLSIKE